MDDLFLPIKAQNTTENTTGWQEQKGREVCSYNCPEKNKELECGPVPNVMAALPNIGGALCSTPQSFADAHYKSVVQ